MNDMSRSAIYESYHEIISIEKRKGKFSKKIEFVGPICESSDTFGVYKNFSKLKEGDFVPKSVIVEIKRLFNTNE